jgi:hypothetical protein
MLKAPFIYFGGKSMIADFVWSYLGQVDNYIEPFCGSAAMVLACPYDLPIVTINDADGFISNFWRSIIANPDEVAKWLDYPVIEQDLFARHVWLVKQAEELTRRLETDPDYYDAKIAGWWCWGACAWIGSGWCSGKGPWSVENGQVVNLRSSANAGQGVNRQRPHLGDAGHGVNRKRPHLGDAGHGVNRKLPHLSGSGITADTTAYLSDYMNQLKDALRRARVCCGDWERVCGSESTTIKHGLTGVFLDPPYGAEAGRANDLYTRDSLSVAGRVRNWCIRNGDNPLMRIALCGYDVEHTDLIAHGWIAKKWKAGNSYGNSANGNNKREVVWFSPHCLDPMNNGKTNGNLSLEHLPMFNGYTHF